MGSWWLFTMAGNRQTITVNTEHDPQEVLDCNFMELFFYECAKLWLDFTYHIDHACPFNTSASTVGCLSCDDPSYIHRSSGSFQLPTEESSSLIMSLPSWELTYPLRKVLLSWRWFSQLPVWWDMLVPSGVYLSQISHLWIQCEATYLLYNLKKFLKKKTAFFNTKISLRFSTSQFNVAVVATSTQPVDFRPRHCNPKKVAQLGDDMACILSLRALQRIFWEKKQMHLLKMRYIYI